MFQAAGLGDVLEGYLGERPRADAQQVHAAAGDAEASASWHQDGAFMGTGLRTVNVWWP
jgi:hypothetical protein